MKRPRKSIHERPEVHEADDAKSQYQVRRPGTKIEGRKEKYFEDDSDQEVSIKGSIFDKATELRRPQMDEGGLQYEREPTEYYDSEYYDSEEEAEMEAQNQMEKDIMEKVDKYLKNTELFDKN